MSFFSIITVSYNAENLIRETIDSVLMQDFEDYEIIVKDACSKDNTLSMIPDNEKIKIYSTVDKGIYYGMNEAIDYASGEYILFLNCGDLLSNSSVLLSVYKTIKENQADIIYGDYFRNNIVCKQPSRITEFYLYRTPLCHQSMFFKKDLFYSLCKYNTEFKICADYEFTVHSLKAGKSFAYCNTLVCKYLLGGVSESEEGKLQKSEEYKRIKDCYYSKAKQKYFDFKLFLSLKGLRQKLVSDNSPLFIRILYRRLVNFVNR